MSLFVPVKIVPDDPKFIPQYQTAGAANADLVVNLNNTNTFEYFGGPPVIFIQPRKFMEIDTGIRIQLPHGWKAEISARSGWARRGLIVTNAPGQIDEDYRGRIVLLVANMSSQPIEIKPGDRIAQIWPSPVYRFAWQVVDDLDETERGEGGFGSTGGMSQ